VEKCQAHHLGNELRNEAGAYLVTYSLRMAQGPLVEYLELHPALRTSGVSAGWWALHVAGLQLAWGDSREGTWSLGPCTPARVKFLTHRAKSSASALWNASK